MTLIAGRLALSKVMTSLADRRPVFHSEADFQFEFARTVAHLDPDIRIRLEVPVRGTRLEASTSTSAARPTRKA